MDPTQEKPGKAEAVYAGQIRSCTCGAIVKEDAVLDGVCHHPSSPECARGPYLPAPAAPPVQDRERSEAGEAGPVDDPVKVVWPGLIRLPLRHPPGPGVAGRRKGSSKLYAKPAERVTKDGVAIPSHWKLPTPKAKVEPDHYTRFEIEPVEFVMRNNIGYAEGNVIKYVCRYDAKEGLVDLYKARRYLDFLIGREEGVKEFWA